MYSYQSTLIPSKALCSEVTQLHCLSFSFLLFSSACFRELPQCRAFFFHFFSTAFEEHQAHHSRPGRDTTSFSVDPADFLWIRLCQDHFLIFILRFYGMPEFMTVALWLFTTLRYSDRLLGKQTPCEFTATTHFSYVNGQVVIPISCSVTGGDLCFCPVGSQVEWIPCFPCNYPVANLWFHRCCCSLTELCCCHLENDVLQISQAGCHHCWVLSHFFFSFQ